MVPRVAMFTMAGDTFLIIGDSEGTGVSPTASGIPAEAAGITEASVSHVAQTRGMDFMCMSGERAECPHRESHHTSCPVNRPQWHPCIGMPLRRLDFLLNVGRRQITHPPRFGAAEPAAASES